MEAMTEIFSRNSFSTVPLIHPPQIIPSSSLSSSHIPIQPHPPQQFPTYLQTPNVSPRARILCEILARAQPNDNIEAVLASTGIQPSSHLVEEVLKLSYGSHSAAVKFFWWAGMTQKHSPDGWNLMVDLLGKNGLFEPVWETIRLMKKEGFLSIATFLSVFESYCAAGRINSAIMSFNVMEGYGIKPNVLAVNCLLSAICREENQTTKALDFFEKIKNKIAPDSDSFAILLEGCEKEAKVKKAKNIFGEMVIRVGWSPQNMSAYHSFLKTLVLGSEVDEAFKFLELMKGKKCLPGLEFFSNAIDILIKNNDSTHVVALWNIMVDSGLVPNLTMYNAIIGMFCKNDDIDSAFSFLDKMVFDGAFPDSLTYNTIFQCLIENKKVEETGKFFYEMIKNEWSPTPSNCATAITMLFDHYDPEMAIEIWDHMMKNHVVPLDESANAVLIGLCDMDRLSEVKKFAETTFHRRITIYESTMTKLKNTFDTEGSSAHDLYGFLSRMWRSS